MKNIFRQIIEAEQYLSSLADCDSFRKEALSVVKAFAWSGIYSDYSKKAVVIKTIMWKETDAAAELGVKPEAVRKYRSRLSNDAFAVIGVDAVDKIREGTKRQAQEIVATIKINERGYSSTGLFSPRLLSLVKEMSVETGEKFELSECKPEMTFLHWFSALKIEEMLDRVDAERIGYLLRVLDGKAGTPKDRTALLKVITCDDPSLHCKPEDRKLFSFPPTRQEFVE
ncbi:hypothetical protein [Ruminococcus sp.]|uniref:hypothetical protein n=1 Tax=Ruminococcus sp. TaxID=41978 RepID=UPI003966A690